MHHFYHYSVEKSKEGLFRYVLNYRFGTLASQFGVIHNVVMRGVHFFIQLCPWCCSYKYFVFK